MHDLEEVPVQQRTRRSSSGAHPTTLSGLRVGFSFGQGRYRLGELLGYGGTCVVHDVRDLWLDRQLAGKFMIVDHPSVAVHARLEARATARLRHPNIVALIDAGFCGAVPFLLMERLEGRTLAQELTHGPLSLRRALSIVVDVASAVAYAHRQGVLHLDLKPGNVHVSHDGTVKLLDFGVGGTQGASTDLVVGDACRGSGVVGTPCYMAPEQWNLGQLDARTDVWALGLLLSECLSGEVPSNGQHPGFALLSDKGFAAPLLKRRFGLPTIVYRVIEHAVAVAPEKRFQTVREFENKLRLVSRLLLEDALAEFTDSERWVLAITCVAGAEFQESELQLLSCLPANTISTGLSTLTRRGFVRVCQAGAEARYHVMEPALARACFERAPVHILRQ